MTHVSLFSGIGGIDLAAEWAGFRTVQFVEKDPFCQKVLAKHWPEVPIHDDVTTFDATRFHGATLVSGGFPCQDVSRAGLGDGVFGTRTGLFQELIRVVCEVRPRFALLENVTGLLDCGVGAVLSRLAEVGFDAEWSVLSACAVGAPCTRERVFIVAYPHGEHGRSGLGIIENRATENECRLHPPSSRGWNVPYSGVRGMASRVPGSVDRIRALGNSVHPPQAYPILKAIAEAA